MKLLLLGLLFAVGCASKVAVAPVKVEEPASKPAPLHLVYIEQVKDFLFLFPNKERAIEWCFEHRVQCRGVDVEINPVK